MQAVKLRDSNPELALRRELRALGLRGYRVDARLPIEGVRRRSDVSFGPARVAVFVDGCYWHMCPEHGSAPKSNSEWWRNKFENTRRRDKDTDRRLLAAGWVPIRVWEHEDPKGAARRVQRAVSGRPRRTR
jgi:DNA mismatch endonuclease (patch repair protein)